MSFVISVQASLPWAQPWDDGIASSGSDASSNASMVTMVCSSNSRIAPRTVAAMGSLRHRALPIVTITTMYWTLYDARRYDKREEVRHDFPSFPLAQDRVRELRARLKWRSQLRCGGSTARHRAVSRGGGAKEHAGQPHHRDPRAGRSRLGRPPTRRSHRCADLHPPGRRCSLSAHGPDGRGPARPRQRWTAGDL